MPTEDDSLRASAELRQSSAVNESISYWVSIVLGVVCFVLLIVLAFILRMVYVLKKRPRVKKTFVVNRNVTPLTSRPPLPPDQCEITIENCCNMNICETVSKYTV